MRVPVGLILAAVLLAPLLAGVPARAQGLDALIEGPSAIGVGAAAKYNVTTSGGPGEQGGNLTVKYWLTGSDLAGAGPTPSLPETTTVHNATRVLLNVTAPSKEQVITLHVEVNSSLGSTSETRTFTKAITVVTPVVLQATFRNLSGVAALNVTVDFAVDGASVGSAVIPRIDPGTIATAQFSWLPVGLSPGTHTVTASADLNRNGVIEPALGEVQSVGQIYKSSPELPWGYIALLVAAIVLAGLVANSAIKRRRQQRT